MQRMTTFNPMTVVAAADVIASFHSHQEMEILDAQWALGGRTAHTSKSGRVALLARLAINENPDVLTLGGKASLARAIVEIAIGAPPNPRRIDSWNKLVAGLRFDGFELVDIRPKAANHTELRYELRKMLPENVPETDFRKAASEVEALLDRHGLGVANGHLAQAIHNYSQGNWSAANAMIRDFYQEMLDKFAEYLGCDPNLSDDKKRQYLSEEKSGPFFLH